MENTMTKRDFLTAIVNGQMTDDVVEYARLAIEKMDTANEKRKSKPSKTALANEPIKAAILDLIAKDNSQCASTVSAALEISVQKASSLLRQLVAEDKLESFEQKVAKKGKVKFYSLKTTD